MPENLGMKNGNIALKFLASALFFLARPTLVSISGSATAFNLI